MTDKEIADKSIYLIKLIKHSIYDYTSQKDKITVLEKLILECEDMICLEDAKQK